MKSERDFYYQKVKDIDHILDVYKEASVDTLIQTIKEILYLPPDKIAMVTDSG
jgi:anionic cell wall polymer biosynthesis LytR-Cps2A-Psr (LCP) family protein